MRIEIDSVLICDSANGDLVAGYRVAGSRTVDIVDTPNGEEVTPFDRQNIKTAVAFNVTRLHESLDDASDFITMHFAELQGSGNVAFTFYGSNGSEMTRQLDPAVIEVADAEQFGLTTVVQYQITGGKMKMKNAATT